jgi:phosphate transport system substrate-binding protein
MALRRSKLLFLLALVIAALAVVAAGCGGGSDEESSDTAAATTEAAPAEETTADTAAPAEETTEEATGAVSGTIEIDGSSTVGPLSTAAAEAFQGENPDTVVTVGISGTGGGFERFCAGETDISDASRQIDEEEAALCAEAGIEYVELPVAVDALTVVVNPENDWANCLTTEQLATIWAPDAEGTVTNWNQVDPSFPDQALVLAGPGTDSGTFDYFTDAINGEEGASRADYTASEDDNVTVQAVAGDKGALGYLGYTYYEENSDTLKAVEIDGGGGCVAPSAEAAQNGTYTPLSRPLYIYVKTASLTDNPAVLPFVQYYLDNIDAITSAALFIAPTPEEIETAQSNLAAAAG